MTTAIETFKEKIPDYARDVRINISTVLTPEGSPGLSRSQIFAIALASAYAARERETIRSMENTVSAELTPEQIKAAKSSAVIMAMNNVYYRFLHLAGDEAYRSMPARLRMGVIANPGVDKVDFELYSLAVSAVNGCGACVQAHAKKIVEHGLSKESVQSAVRIAAVIQSAAQVQFVENTKEHL